MSYIIEVRLIGDDLKPEKMSSRDIGQLISAVEEMIASLVARDNPALGIDESEVSVGLSSVQQGSYVLQFETPYESASRTAYSTITTAITKGSYDVLPFNSVEALKTIRKITRKYKTDTQFWEKNGKYNQLATVTPNLEIDTEISYISGKTTLYGYVAGIVGDNPPRVTLRLLNGHILRCNVTQDDNLRVARILGQRLYSYTGLRGKARWDIRDMSIQYFLVEDVTGYKKTSIDKALDALYDIAGEDYNRIDNINSLVADIRGNDEEF